VTDHRFLAGPGHYRDSGMMGLATNEHPRAFWQADLDEAAGMLLKIMQEVRPQVMITYDDHGFYGHPDHIQAHRVAMRAAEMAGETARQDLLHGDAAERSRGRDGDVPGSGGQSVRGCVAGRGPAVRYAERRDRGTGGRDRPVRAEGRRHARARHPDPAQLMAVRHRR
jgi:hypothetical protein